MHLAREEDTTFLDELVAGFVLAVILALFGAATGLVASAVF